MDGHSDADGEFDDYREALFDLLRQPSVSATGEGMDEAAAHVVSLFDDCGFESVTRIETSTYPLVYAERLATNPETVPTVVFYGHYDVQPAGDPDEWESPPFEPTVRDGSIYARGAGDNKGQFAAHAFAVDLLDRSGEFPEANVKLLVEGEEESGSAGLREYLGGTVGAGADGAPAPEIADADLVFVADGPRHAVATDDGREGRPTLVYGNRGVLSFEVAHRTANTDLHSGNFGGPVPPATNELVEALSSMFDGDRITVDGFYDGVETTDAARELAERVPDDSEALAAELGLTHLATDRPYYERLLLEPTMTVNGLSGGYQGEGTKTVLPCRAGAKLDCRLVPEQDPDAVFERVREHLARVAPDAEVTKQSTFPPTSTPVDAPVAAPALRALESVWGEEPVELPLLGGSLPAAFFREVPALSDVPVLVVPYANHDQGNHSPNEHLDVDCFENGVLTTAAFLREFADADIGA